jgi:hypothetical protein
MNYSSIIINWNNKLHENVDIIKSKAAKLIPKWDWDKNVLHVIPHVVADEYIISTCNFKCKQCIIYNINTNKFAVKNKNYRDLLPDPLVIHKSFVININNTNISYIIFGKITGLHFLHCITMNETYDHIYNSSDDWFKSIDHIESNKLYSACDNTLAKKKCYFIFSGDSIMGDRYQYWYFGKWKKHVDIEIKSNYDFEHDSEHMTQWCNKLGIIYYDKKYEKDELLNFDKFKDFIQYYPFNHFTCNNCSKIFCAHETYFHINNAFNNLCIDCYICGKYEFIDDKFKLIDDDIYKSMFILHSESLKKI